MVMIIRYNPLPGKTAECDRWVKDKLVPYFCQHQECQGIEVLEDVLIGDPERTCVVRLNDVCSATSIMESEEARTLKHDFMNYASDFSSQILNTIVERGSSRSVSSTT